MTRTNRASTGRIRSRPGGTRRAVATIVLCLTALPCAQPLGLHAAQQTTPTDLLVQVRDEAGEPLAGREILVVVSNGQEVTDQLTGTTDESGDVRFDGVAAGEGYTARPVAVSDGFPYQGERVALTPGVAATLPLTIASVSEAPANLHINVLHIILNVVEPGLYQALQVMSVLNVGETAAYNGEVFNGERVGMVIPLPEGAGSRSPLPPEISGLDESRLVQDGSRLLDLRPVPPGNRQVAVQYEIVADPDGGDVVITVPHPTAQVSLLVGPGLGAVVLESDQLAELEPVDIEGQGQYANYTSDVLPAGGTLRFTIGPPHAAISPEAWALLGLAVALLVSAVASIALTRPRAPDPAARQALIAEIARLDTQREAGALDAATYNARRGEALGRLMEMDGIAGTTEATPEGAAGVAGGAPPDDGGD